MAPKDFSDLTKMFGGMDMTKFDPSAFMEIQRKNVEALVAANQAIAENMRSIAEQEQKYLQEMVENWSEAAQGMQFSGDVGAATTKQMELALTTLQKGIDNMRTLQDMVSEGKEESLKIISKRVDDSIAEVRAVMDKTGK